MTPPFTLDLVIITAWLTLAAVFVSSQAAVACLKAGVPCLARLCAGVSTINLFVYVYALAAWLWSVR